MNYFQKQFKTILVAEAENRIENVSSAEVLIKTYPHNLIIMIISLSFAHQEQFLISLTKGIEIFQCGLEEAKKRCKEIDNFCYYTDMTGCLPDSRLESYKTGVVGLNHGRGKVYFDHIDKEYVVLWDLKNTVIKEKLKYSDFDKLKELSKYQWFD